MISREVHTPKNNNQSAQEIKARTNKNQSTYIWTKRKPKHITSKSR